MTPTENSYDKIIIDPGHGGFDGGAAKDRLKKRY